MSLDDDADGDDNLHPKALSRRLLREHRDSLPPGEEAEGKPSFWGKWLTRLNLPRATLATAPRAANHF